MHQTYLPAIVNLRKSGLSCLVSEYEIHSSEQAQASPDVIGLEGLVHIEEGEWHKDAECNYFLGDF